MLNRVEEVIGAQWVAVGAALTGMPCMSSVVDPEALVVTSCSLGRFNPRLFDESLDWACVNHRLLKKSRLGFIASEYGEETNRVLAAFAQHISITAGADILGRLGKAGVPEGQSKNPETFWLPETGISPETGASDEIFLKYGFMRGRPRMRGNSGKPDLGNPANLMLRLRQEYGKGARADCITFLISGGRGSSNAIASRIKYKQPSVYTALEQLVNAGVVQKYSQSGWSDYWIDEPADRFSRIYGPDKGMPVFIVWSDIFRAFYLIMRDFAENGALEGNSLKAIERARKLTTAVVPMIRNSGGPFTAQPVPDINKTGGERNISQLREFLESSAEIMKSTLS
ncbi:MAG: hypothetical protein JW738_07570 [Actinobacteria bacterium]|nr:hypothetical protein [Actinomycetota bacterium]